MKIKCNTCSKIVTSDKVVMKAGGLGGIVCVCDECYERHGFEGVFKI